MTRESSLVPTNLLGWPKADGLLPDQRLILLWLWACPYLSCAGCGLIERRAAAATLGLDPAALAGGLETLANAGLIEIDHATGEVFVLDWFRFHSFRTSRSLGVLRAAITKISSDFLRRRVLEAVDKSGIQLNQELAYQQQQQQQHHSKPPLPPKGGEAPSRAPRGVGGGQEIRGLNDPADRELVSQVAARQGVASQDLADELVGRRLRSDLGRLKNVRAWLSKTAKSLCQR